MERTSRKFPKRGMNQFKLYREILPKLKSVRRKGGPFLGYPHTTPFPIAVLAYKKFVKYNSNHVGTITRFEGKLTYTRQKELEVIQMMGDLYGDRNIDGYVTSGGTEGNIYGIWLGYRFLKDTCNSEVTVLSCELTHQSIDKAVSLQQISHFTKIPTNSYYQMDPNKLYEAIEDYAAKGIYSFLVVATSGYTVTGTQDDLREMEEKIDELKKKHKIEVYIHVDAAIGGLVFPFLYKDSNYFTYKYVKSVSVDPHKMGCVPLSAGLFLCRKDLQKHVEIEIPYVERKVDDTLTGSRNATSALAIWAVFNQLGYEGFQRKLERSLLLKEKTKKLFAHDKRIYVLPYSKINMICFTLDGGRKKLRKEIEDKYGLDLFPLPFKDRTLHCYKIYFMPHATYHTIEELYRDILSELN